MQFSYATRPDTTTDYLSGSVIKIQHRMTNIKTYNGTKLVKDYRITYANTGAYSTDTNNVANGSLLTRIVECDGAAAPGCLKPTQFTWTPGPIGTAVFGAVQNWGYSYPTPTFGDINGDGRMDYVYQLGGQVYVGYSTGSAFTAATALNGVTTPCQVSGSWGCTDYFDPRLADVNGDGLADLVTGGGQIRLSTGNGFGPAQNWGYAASGRISFGDINGDGRADYVYPISDQVYVGYSTGSGFTAATAVSGGKLACLGTSTYGSCSLYATLWLADVNGDGLADLIIGNGQVMLATGSGFATAQNWGYVNTSRIYLGDINGDGRMDYVYTKNTLTQEVYAGFSTGNAFTPDSVISGVYAACSSAPCANHYPPLLADVNGDGQADVLTGQGQVQLSLVPVADQLTAITGGLGDTTTVSYKKLSDSTVYSAESGAAYPTRDILPVVPLTVVSAASSSDGIGGTITTNYSYGGLKADAYGRGSLGFRWMKSSNADGDLAVTTFYRQDYPYIGLPSQVEKRKASDNTLLSAAANTYATQSLGGTRQFPYVAQTLEYQYELDGSLVTGTTTGYQYDAYGNVTQVVVNSGDGYVKTTTSVYANTPANWILGRLLRSSVTTTSP